MKRLIVTFSLAACGCFAATFNGTVVDTMCKGNDLAKHTKDCAVKCSKRGYGLVTSDGKFLKFDEKGNSKALAALKKSSKNADLKATVKGTQEGDVLKVDSISID